MRLHLLCVRRIYEHGVSTTRPAFSNRKEHCGLTRRKGVELDYCNGPMVRQLIFQLSITAILQAEGQAECVTPEHRVSAF